MDEQTAEDSVWSDSYRLSMADGAGRNPGQFCWIIKISGQGINIFAEKRHPVRVFFQFSYIM